MIKIYHNPRCSKSREGVVFLEKKDLDFEIIKYLEVKFTTESLTDLLSKLNMEPIELVRKTEAIWKTDFKGKNLTNSVIIKAMVENPKLIERPIVLHNNRAVVARPVESINTIL